MLADKVSVAEPIALRIDSGVEAIVIEKRRVSLCKALVERVGCQHGAVGEDRIDVSTQDVGFGVAILESVILRSDLGSRYSIV